MTLYLALPTSCIVQYMATATHCDSQLCEGYGLHLGPSVRSTHQVMTDVTTVPRQNDSCSCTWANPHNWLLQAIRFRLTQMSSSNEQRARRAIGEVRSSWKCECTVPPSANWAHHAAHKQNLSSQRGRIYDPSNARHATSSERLPCGF